MDREPRIAFDLARLIPKSRTHWLLTTLGLAGVIVFVAARSHIVETFVLSAALLAGACGILSALTFRRRVRITIGGLGLKYKAIRYGAARIAAAGFFLLLLQRLSIAVWAHYPAAADPAASLSTIDRVTILEELRAKRFDELDAQLKSVEHFAERDVALDEKAWFAFRTFASANPDIGPLLDQWEQRSSASWVPHLAKAEHLVGAGWRSRGDA